MHHSTSSHEAAFDYNNNGWPRDFDIRIEVAEQQEILSDARWRNPATAPYRLVPQTGTEGNRA